MDGHYPLPGAASPYCTGDVGIDSGEVEWIRERDAQLAEVITAAASIDNRIQVITLGGVLEVESDATTVPPTAAQIGSGLFDNHQVCNPVEWINGVSPTISVERVGDAMEHDISSLGEFIGDRTYHPNAAGYEVMAEALEALIP